MTVQNWPIERVIPYARNPRRNEHAVEKVASSLAEFGWQQPIVVDAAGVVIVGHTRLLAAKRLGYTEVPVHVADGLTPSQVRAYRIADNRTAEEAEWDDELLALEIEDLKLDDYDLALTGLDSDELTSLLAFEGGQAANPEQGASSSEDSVPALAERAVTRPGEVWALGDSRLICGSCRDASTITKLFGQPARLAAVAVTSPPYAAQRVYDQTSAFEPIPPDEYVDWYRDVAATVQRILADDGSYFLNIKEHAEEGERHLYVKDLVLAHKRIWGWRFVDEFCWRKTDNGVPGGWQNRFKNAWEPVFHFSRQGQIKFRPEAVSHESADCFDYSPSNPKSTSGSGLLGSGKRGMAADAAPNGSAMNRTRNSDEAGRHVGLARPSNVIEARTETSQGNHSAPYPVALPEFFIKAYSDPGDLIFDPFMGSGTTLIAAVKNGRVAYGTEISPLYTDQIVRRWQEFTKQEARDADGVTFAERSMLAEELAA